MTLWELMKDSGDNEYVIALTIATSILPGFAFVYFFDQELFLEIDIFRVLLVSFMYSMYFSVQNAAASGFWIAAKITSKAQTHFKESIFIANLYAAVEVAFILNLFHANAVSGTRTFFVLFAISALFVTLLNWQRYRLALKV